MPADHERPTPAARSALMPLTQKYEAPRQERAAVTSHRTTRVRNGPASAQVFFHSPVGAIWGQLINIEAICATPSEALALSPSQMPLSCLVAPPKRQMPLSCPVAPPSQRELHKDGGGGGGGVARRARAARAPKAKSCATSSAASSAALTCWRRRRRRWWWWCCGRGVQCAVVVAHRWPHMHAPGGRRGRPP